MFAVHAVSGECLTFASTVRKNCLCEWSVGHRSLSSLLWVPAWLLGFGQQQQQHTVQTKWLISKEERGERGREGAGGGNDSFMAAEKEERDGEWQKKESE